MSKINTLGYFDTKGNKKCPYKDLISDRGFSEKLFYFPDGLPGFKDNKEFAFLFSKNSNPFILMNFCGETKLSFMCLDPFCVLPNYKPVLSNEDKLLLNVMSKSEIVFLSIVKIDKKCIEEGNFSEGELIIKSPLAINPKNYYGKQIVISNAEYLEPHKFKDIKKME